VVVVGGGVAGLEAALTAAGLGHRVVLLEASERLGGQLRAAPATTYRSELAHLTAYLARAVTEAGVEVRLGVVAGVDAVLGLEPESVIVATGSSPGHPADAPPAAVRAPAVLDGSVQVGPRVLVAHDGGHPWEFDVVLELLVGAGHQVTAAVPGPALAGRGTDFGLFSRLTGAGLTTWPGTAVVGFVGGRAELRSTFTGSVHAEGGFDDLVLAGTRRACDDLALGLRPHLDAVSAVGDSLAPRSVRDALWEGRAAARRIGHQG
jgi:2,4-dienoyl-CoA reductase (NADPH2)